MAGIAAPAEPKPPLSYFIQEIGIRKLDPDRMQRAFKAEKQKEGDGPALIQHVVDKYNAAHPQPDGEPLFKPIPFPQDEWQKIDTKGFSLLSYSASVETKNAISSMLQALGLQAPQPRDVSHLFFLYRIHKKAMEIFTIASGTRGYQPVQSFADYRFPRQIAFRLLEPKQSQESSKQITGPVVSSSANLRSSFLFDPSRIQKIYTAFTAALRKNASLLKLKVFRKKDGKVPKHPTEITIREATVRVKKSLPFETYPSVVDHFAQISRGDETYLYGSKKKVEKDADEGFAFLKYFSAIPWNQRFALNDHLLLQLAKAIKNNTMFDWEVSHPHSNDYFKAHQFRLQYKRPNGGIVETNWEGHRLTMQGLIQWIRKCPYFPIHDEKALKNELSRIHFAFRSGKEWKSVPLIHCLTGQVNVKDKGTFFKLSHHWYEISSNLLRQVDSQFRDLLVKCRLKNGQEGFLDHPWQSKPLDLTASKMKKALNLTSDQVEILCDLDVAFIDKDGKVLHKHLEGEILSHPVIDYYKEEILDLLGQGKVELAALQDMAGQGFAKTIWDELVKQRKVVQKKTVKRKKKDKEILIVRNPFLPVGQKFPKKKALKKQLRQLATQALYTMDEGAYNETFLYDRKNPSKKPYKMGKEGWLVGDRICPKGIELFDILRWTEDTLYLYHVKEGFGQKTRDAASQIMNSARLLSESSKTKKAILNQWFEMATKKPEKGSKDLSYREKVRKQLLALGKKNFLSLFEDRDIVFVYAFSDDRVDEHLITDEGLKKDRFSKEDFATGKTKAVAKKIFKRLQKQGYLDKEGKRGVRFNDLHSMEGLQFKDEALKAHQKAIWEILAGDMTYFTSLIGRMDLLHARAQVEGNNEFSFKICQIPRPNKMKRSEVMPGILNFSKVDEDIAFSMREIAAQDIIFYRSAWSDEPESFSKEDTVGDGSCALHALLGVEEEGIFRCDPALARQNFVQRLRDQLNEDGDGFIDDSLNTLYQNNIRSLIQEAERPDVGINHPAYQIRKCAKAVFKNGGDNLDSFETYCDKKFRASQIEQMKEVVKSKKAKQGVLSILRNGAKSSEKLADLKTRLLSDEESLYDTFSQSLNDLSSLSGNSRTYRWMQDSLGECETLREEQSEAIDDLIESQDVMENFLNQLTEADYWLTDDELQMLAHTNDLRVEILREDVTGDYGCNNYLDLEPRENDDRDLVVIHGSGNHFSRCIRFGEDG